MKIVMTPLFSERKSNQAIKKELVPVTKMSVTNKNNFKIPYVCSSQNVRQSKESDIISVKCNLVALTVRARRQTLSKGFLPASKIYTILLLLTIELLEN